MYTVWQNGVLDDCSMIIGDINQFYIQRDDSVLCYANDEVVFEIKNEISNLYSVVSHCYLAEEEYYKKINSIPIWVCEGGLSSDYAISKEEFAQFKDASIIFPEELNKWIYANDCRFLVSTLSVLIESLELCYLEYFEKIIKIDTIKNNNNDGVWVVSGALAYDIIFRLETFFIKAYSILDNICKIAYVIENNDIDFRQYKKINCNKILWGDRKKLVKIKRVGTLFEAVEIISLIECLRNEVVHNGTWEESPKVYVKIVDGKIVERFVLFPDFTDGRLDCFKNRKRFFSKAIKANDILPDIYNEFMIRLYNTITMLMSVR